MVVKITLLNDFGIPIPGYNRFLVNLVFGMGYIYNHNGTAKRFVFSKLYEESVGGSFCIISNTQQKSNMIQNNIDIRNSQNTSSLLDSSETSKNVVPKRKCPTLPPIDLEIMKI